MSNERIIRVLQKIGFEIIKHGKHTSMAKGKYIVTIPRHNRTN
ncbi:MAG: type II toxin-antitoxin system HicA family toxin [Candidatus Hydrogenedentota bacterium]